jgi:serine/threonine-protein kinase
MIGRTLTHYKVVEQLGSGGMGVVYKALDLRLDRHVALKVLPAGKSDDQERRDRFLHEARAASALNDPHIVTVYDIFTEDHTDVLVMELVQGRTLRDILNDGPMPVARAVEIVLQVAEGVGAAHAAGIVHRDLKPGNVMVTERGRVKVLDFGLAKLVGGGAIADQPTISSPATVAGVLLGTVDYMSPEQAKGDPIDARTDVFALGAMLYEMLTGTRPFAAAHAPGVLHEIVYGTIVPPRTRRPEIPAAVAAVVVRALERDLDRRYPSMESLASELRRAQVDEAPTGQVAPLPSRAPAPPVTSAPVVPPPLPRESPRPPAIVERIGTQPGGIPVPLPVATPSRSERRAAARMSRGDRPKRRGSSVRKILVLVMILTVFGWGRAFFSGTRGGRRPDRPNATRSVNDDDIGATVETGVADMLNRIGPQSAGIQLARANIYWKQAQKSRDPDLVKQAEDAYNAVLRLNPDDDEASEAREALQQIAEWKKAP